MITMHAVCQERGVDAELHFPAGETTALIGPNGAGKSTVLQALAGIRRFRGTQVTVAGAALQNDREWVPPHQRHITMLTQDPLLFARMSVVDNVAFGVRARGRGKEPARKIALDWLERVGAQALAQVPAHQLSGGQAQRVAVARALAASPEVLVLDEPLAALDVETASQMRHVLHQEMLGRTCVIATHSILDVALLASRVAVLNEGHLVDTGERAQVFAQPRDRFTASFAGKVLVRGQVTRLDGATAHVTCADAVTVTAHGEGLTLGAEVLVVVQPGTVTLATDPTPGSVADTVTRMDVHGDLVRVHGRYLAADTTPECVSHLELEAPIFFTPPPDLVAYPA